MQRKISKTKIEFFQRALLKWYKTNGRDFAWRKPFTSEYEIIISEVLLQRTKAETVAKFFPLFLDAYPGWTYLAAATIEELEEALRPIGLYRQRASRLRALALAMKDKYYQIPQEVNDLNELPMFGQYISNAAQLLIHNKPMPLLDVNMARVLERFFEPRKMADIRYDPDLQDLAYKVIDVKDSKKLNWAILDFAATICMARNPKCDICFLREKCNYVLNLS
jgi:A/G-specific adenine glycosylase